MVVTNLTRYVERILEEQTRDGLFPTYRTENTKDQSTPIRQKDDERINNIELHSFIIEKLIRLFKDNPKVVSSFKHGLKVVLDDVINYNGTYLWRWIKEPTRLDYLYPPDYDDTLRAAAVIETAKEYTPDLIKYFEKNEKYPSELINQNYTKILLEDLFWIDGDFKPIFDPKRSTRGIFTFSRKFGFKEHNEIDPVVNANVLYSYLLYLKNRKKEKDEIVDGIRSYLSDFILSERFNQGFEGVSRFYLSSALFTNIVADIINLDPNIFSEGIRSRLISGMKDYTPRNVLETAWCSGALLKLGYKKQEIEKYIERIIEESKDDIWEAYPFYQHKRLNHVFGSKAATSIFCLETLIKNETK